MASRINYDKLDSLIRKPSVSWVDQANWLEENESWLGKSARIALQILKALKDKGISQKDLADSIGVTPQYISKIIKGRENLSLETISKIEAALGLVLVEIPDYIPVQAYYRVSSDDRVIQSNYLTISIGSFEGQYSTESNYLETYNHKRA